MRRSAIFATLSIAGAVLITLAIVSQTVGLSPYQPSPPATAEEEYRNLVDLLAQGALEEALDAANKNVGLSVALLDSAALDEMKEYTRHVRVTIGQLLTEEEIKEGAGLEEIPQEIQEAMVDGFLLSTVSDETVLGVLVEDEVLVSLAPLHLIEIPEALVDRIYIEVILLPDIDTEDNWKSELLFRGGLVDLLQGEHELYLDLTLGAFRRPEEKLILVPDDYSYDNMLTENVRQLERVVYLRPMGSSIAFDVGTVSLANAEQDAFVIGGRFDQQDHGAPVFVLRDDGNPSWAGVLVTIDKGQGNTATALGVRTITERKGKK